MRSRLDAVSGANFGRVARQALERSGKERIDVLVPVHVKRSMHRQLEADLGAKRSVYLEGYGHMQAADQMVRLKRDAHAYCMTATSRCFSRRGVGYTWSATVGRIGRKYRRWRIEAC